MSVSSTIAKRIISRLVTKGSPEVRRHAADQIVRGFEEITYRRLAERGFLPSAIIDVGAYEGNWTRLANRAFGPTPTLMVEAQSAKRPILESVIRDLPRTRLASAVLSARSGEELPFFEMETGSSLLPEMSNAPRKTRTVTTQVLDDVVQQVFPSESPLFLKIDVQGAELNILRGGASTLARCELVQLEVAMLQYNEGAPLLPEVVAFMAERDFLPIEVSGFSRPRDVLVQIDLIFAHKASSLRPDRFIF